MSALLAYALLTVLGCILWSARKRRHARLLMEQHARRRRMEIARDIQVCRQIAALPESKEAND